MLGFLPIFILLGAIIAVSILSFVPRGAGIAWLVAVLASIGAWAAALAGKSRLPFTFSGHLFADLAIQGDFPALQFDIITWPIVMAICSAVIAILIVSSARIGLDSNSQEWVGILGLGVIGILGSLAANILTALVILGIFDLFDLLFVLFLAEPEEKIVNHLKRTAWNLSSLILFLLAYAWQLSFQGAPDDWKSLMPGPGSVVLIGCMMRMVLIPFKKIMGFAVVSTNGLFNARYIIGLLISTAIVLQLPFHAEPSTFKNYGIIYLFLIALISAFWLVRHKKEDEAAAWRAFAGSMVCAEYLYGFSASAICFTVCAVVLIQIMLLVYPISRFTQVLGILALAGYSGLPFTPNTTGLAGFSWVGQVPGFIFLFPAILVFFAYLRNLLRKESFENPMAEMWATYISQAGLLFPVISPWIILLNWQPELLRLNFSVQSIVVSAAGTLLFVAEKMQLFNYQESLNRAKVIVKRLVPQRIGVINGAIFAGNLPQEVFRQPFTFITALFEGDGGFIWAILCLVLVITILRGLGFS